MRTDGAKTDFPEKLHFACLVVALFTLMGCVRPGREALVENSEREGMLVAGDEKAIAYCVTTVLDNEKWGIWDLPARVTRTLQNGDTTQLQSGAPTAVQTLLWEASFTQVAPNSTSVEIIGRRNALATLPSNYMLEKVKAAISKCAGSN